MWKLCVASVLVVFSTCAVAEPSDYEIWVDGQNVTTSNSSETNTNLTDVICAAELIKINKKMEKFDFVDLECAAQLKTLVADNIGLLEINNVSMELLPSSVQNLTIARNKVQRINAGIFSNLTTLRHLNLSSNKIESIAPSAFDYMKNLTSISLDHNDLRIYNITFIECPKLKVISLKYNFIKQLSEGSLHHLKHNVLTIFLSYNNIREAHKSSLDVKQFHEVHLDHNELQNAQLLIKLVKAEIVDLSDNHITCLPKEFMENGLSKIKMLNLSGNPLECHCLQDLQRKVRKNIEFQKMSPLVQNISIVLPKNTTKTC